MTRQTGTVSRRGFLSGALKAGALFYIVPRHVLGGPGYTPPSETITRAVIGTGGMGMGHVVSNPPDGAPVTLAVCDVDANHRERAREKAGAGCKAYSDWREVLDRKDIDTIHVATPPHWHALIAIAAAEAGFDVLGEKPMSRTIAESQSMVQAFQRYGRMYHVNTFFRYGNYYQYGATTQLRKLVQSGLLGQPLTVHLSRANGFNWKIRQWSGRSDLKPQPVPDVLDYDMWLGPAPQAPYTEKRVHPRVGYGRPGWLRIRDYCAGMITGWGSHHIDIAQWGHGSEYSAVVELQGSAEFPANGLWNVHGDFHVEGRYEDGVRLIIKGGNNGVRFEGSDGWIWVTRGQIDASDKNLLREPIGASEVHLYHSDDHHQNFLDCVRSRKDPIANVEIGHRSATMCYLADIAMRSGRKLHWDPQAEQFINDPIANRRLSQPMRSPWHL